MRTIRDFRGPAGGAGEALARRARGGLAAFPRDANSRRGAPCAAAPGNGRALPPRHRSRRPHLAAAALFPLLLGALVAATPLSCGREAAGTPVPPDAIGTLQRVPQPPPNEKNNWEFLHSSERWDAAYADASGEIRLRTYAFAFPERQIAQTTYEMSRTRVLTGGGGFEQGKQARIGSWRGLRMSDRNGEYFQFLQGSWIVILEGDAAHFEAALRGLRWDEGVSAD